MSSFNLKKYKFAETNPELLKSEWWIGHIPFAFELVRRLRPRTIVELGSYSGSSLAAFCQAVETVGLDARCYGIDLWEGDIHMGKFDEGIFKEISHYMSSRYSDICILMKQEFNKAVDFFDDRSIDLLHIDGTHTYEAVSNDYYTWLPKISDRGVILFHDTNVTYETIGEAVRHFGVRDFFDFIKDRHPHFEFRHCYGLGVLLVGNNLPDEITELLKDAQHPEFFDYFEQLGRKVSLAFENQRRFERDNSCKTKSFSRIRIPKDFIKKLIKRTVFRNRNEF
jgi:predicted O-methyltransferase YrrM